MRAWLTATVHWWIAGWAQVEPAPVIGVRETAEGAASADGCAAAMSTAISAAHALSARDNSLSIRVRRAGRVDRTHFIAILPGLTSLSRPLRSGGGLGP